MKVKGRRGGSILFGISGGIAAYKAVDILHGWVKAGFDVETIMTEAAEAFVSPLVLSTLSGRCVWRESDFLSVEKGCGIPHISLTEWADCFVVAPCTANVLRICAQGDGSTLLGAAMLANKKPLLLFPAMNSNMLSNPAVTGNIEKIRKMGYTVVDPDSGLLACGCEGKGRLPDVCVINACIRRALTAEKDMEGLKVLVTAGPTHEYIDPVRYISNPSSGKMGYALAEAAWYRGAEVTLVSGPVSLAKPYGVTAVDIVSAEDMYNACVDLARSADIVIQAAAVGDFRVEHVTNHKIKRKKGELLTLTLVQNKDIAAELGRVKKAGQMLVGFAAETENLIENAGKKLRTKNLDVIAANNILADGAGFAADVNKITVLTADGIAGEFSGAKAEVADSLLDAVLKIRERIQSC